MRPDQFKKRNQKEGADARARRQIATEAARRMIGPIRPAVDADVDVDGDEAEANQGTGDDPLARVRGASEAEFYAAKRKAAAVLGRAVRPADLPTDAEVIEQAVALLGVDEDEDEDESDSSDGDE